MKNRLAATVVSCLPFAIVEPVFSQALTSATNTYSVGNTPQAMAAADVDGDGKVRLISADFDPVSGLLGNLTVLTNNGSGSFGLDATLNPGMDSYSTESVTVNPWPSEDLFLRLISQ